MANFTLPKKTRIGYKLFVIQNGKLYPPKVDNPNKQDTPVGQWIIASDGIMAPPSKTGRPQVKSRNGESLAYRPGWHLAEIPRASQFDRIGADGIKYFPANFVWALCEYACDIDYQQQSDEEGYYRTRVLPDGSIQKFKTETFCHALAGMKTIPFNGYYKYRTNPNPDTPTWIITGCMRILKILSDQEVADILTYEKVQCPPRQNGTKLLSQLGLSSDIININLIPCRSRLYSIWHCMRQRCNNPKTNWYHLYGGKGITIYSEWDHNFHAFETWALSHGYRDTLSIDRIDSNKNYTPENCRWATPLEQSNNTSRTRFLTYNNTTLSIRQWEKTLNLPRETVRRRADKNWPVVDCLFCPIITRKKRRDNQNGRYRHVDWDMSNLTTDEIEQKLYQFNFTPLEIQDYLNKRRAWEQTKISLEKEAKII